MSAVAATSPLHSPRQISWTRRRAALARTWQRYRRDHAGLAGLGLLLTFVALALTAPLFTDAQGLDVTKATGGILTPPGAHFLLGTDEAGRSVLLLTLWGARISLLVGFLAAAVSISIGAVIGITAGHFHGWSSGLLLRVIDFFLVLPSLPLAIALGGVLGHHSMFVLIVVIGITSWAGTARLIRAHTLAVEASPTWSGPKRSARVTGAL